MEDTVEATALESHSVPADALVDELKESVSLPAEHEQLNEAVKAVVESKDRWVALGVPARIELLRHSMDCTLRAAEGMVRGACSAKGIDFDSPVAAEEWLGGPMTIMRNLRILVQALKDIDETGHPRLKTNAVRRRKDGQLAVEVFPQSLFDKLAFPKFRAEIWMDPTLKERELIDSMALAYQRGAKKVGKVALVLGAGNVASIGPMDVLHKLFVENQVCLLKMNPVNEYLGAHVEEMFRPLVEQGYLRVVYGGAEEGDYLVHHEDVDEVHITGSDTIHDIIVWGSGEEQKRNKEAGTAKLDKPITSELGCVSPVIIVPGQWTKKELVFQATNVATMVANNASFNCNAAKVLVTWENWPQRTEFLAKVEEVLRGLPQRRAYYPGSDQKYDRFLKDHPEAKSLGRRTKDSLPWTTIFDVDHERSEDVVFTSEAWCAILAETALPGHSAGDFFSQAVDFCNDKVWGTLSCSVIASDATQQALGMSFEQALADLRYGSVAVNHWAALAYGLVTTTWGAYPGHTLDEIVSGIGMVHNTNMFERPQKSVVYGPFYIAPKPPWFSTHRKAHKVARSLTSFEHTQSLLKFVAVAFWAILG